MERKIFLLLISGLLTVRQVNTNGCTQLGCNGAGLFAQDNFSVPDGYNRSLAWKLERSFSKMNPESENYGCVSNDLIVVCSYSSSISGSTRHIVINATSGEELPVKEDMIVEDVTMPVLIPNNQLLAVNASHISLIDPIHNKSALKELPSRFKHGVLSPVYLKQLGFFLVIGNLSETVYIYKSGNNAQNIPELEYVTGFKVWKQGSDCAWTPATEIVASDNRIYFFGIHVDQGSGLLAVDILKDTPYFRKAWVLSDDLQIGSKSKSSKPFSTENGDNCTYVPDADPDYAWFPPADVQTQLLAQGKDKIIITSAVGLILVQDHGSSGEQIGITLFGGHFMSLDDRSQSPIAWMTGWQLYPIFRPYVMGLNITGDVNQGLPNILSTFFIPDMVGAVDLNITSRITTFETSKESSTKILVFGASVATNNSGSRFHTKLCRSCQVGLNKVVMALQTVYEPKLSVDVVWAFHLPAVDGDQVEAKGQIIGAQNKLIVYGDNSDHKGYIAAII